MISKIVLSFIICIVIIILTFIVINYAVFLEKVDAKRAYIGSGNPDDEDAENADPTYEDLDFKEGLTDREYYALSSSISQIETVDPSQVFLTSGDISIYEKTKGNSYYNSPINFLGTYDNKNIINYIRELVNINNTTDKKFNELSVASKKTGEVYSNYSSFVNMKNYLKQNKPPSTRVSESKKLLEQEKTSARLMGTAINSNLDITIKNKLYDARTSLYTDYTEYIATIQQKVNSAKKDIVDKKSDTESIMGKVSAVLIKTIDQSLDKLNGGINDLSSLDVSKFWIKRDAETFKTNIKNNINNLTKYVLVFTTIKNNKITKPDTESGNVPVSIASRIIVYSGDIYDEFSASNKTIDGYLKNKLDDYNDFLNYYDNFDTFTSIDFITRIEQEYLTEDYSNKLKKYINEIDNDTELKKTKDAFAKKCDSSKTVLNRVVKNVSTEINKTVKDSNAAILTANALYIEYKRKEDKPKKKRGRCVIS